MKPAELEQLGLELYNALRNQQMLPPLTERKSPLSLEDAYQISQHFLQHRLNDGERVIGKKIGLTSKVVQEMLGVHQPDFGFLTDVMMFESGSEIPFASPLIQAKSEGEIAFILKDDLQGPNVTPQDVINATQSVAACFEIVDSRVKDWQIKIEDTVADNASCGMFVLGHERVSPQNVDFENCQMVIKNSGVVVARGQGSAALGSPLNCVAWLANTLGDYGISLNAGDIILSGSLAAMIPCQQGDDMSVEIEGIGSASYRFI
ncbi:fumarylacetoacetate hydrolase family protein [Shewanella sp. D64]|uniref:fumarylacetoacetate hydrolase family protein n=1 Tax=unclassified Shewanella TaxID=196818 RepID=UPI0022BA2AE6|nr:MULTISPECIES: fumarylacetoacetate hydrolase family protein [unclassified Shewanella]MEC4727910.1 fumarylacetoacetate hydrolase family protein [Shewanella sp. D64]MEC4739952.1 fumarylacetoacetate hydrolase family protein [Shewanella sp. E94]WBJ97086.1 fumarylacetoacetate hydrolase family protein [Shewanella sp. MTB7]